MGNSNQYGKLVSLIQEICSNSMDAASLSDVVIGEVTSESPLTIRLERGLEIPSEAILLTNNTCLWSVDMTVAHHTDPAAGGSGYAEYASHVHGYSGTKTYLVHNELKTGDKVFLLRISGGQQFIALDRCYNPDRGCAG